MFPPNTRLPEAVLAVTVGPLLRVEDSDCSDADETELVAPAELRQCVEVLLQRQELHGQMDQGVVMNNDTRLRLVSQQSVESLQDMQFGTVEALLKHNTKQKHGEQKDDFQTYISSWLYFHIRGSLREGDAPHEQWVDHSDPVVRLATAKAVGIGCSWQLRQERDLC